MQRIFPVISAVLALAVVAAQAAELPASNAGSTTTSSSHVAKSRKDSPPRKVIVGTTLQRFWGEYPGLDKEIDLSYMILGWRPRLKNGAALKEKYGDKVGFRYYEDEDCGFFWSNDPRVTIGEMARSINMVDWSEEHSQLEKFFRRVHSEAQGKPK